MSEFYKIPLGYFADYVFNGMMESKSEEIKEMTPPKIFKGK